MEEIPIPSADDQNQTDRSMHGPSGRMSRYASARRRRRAVLKPSVVKIEDLTWVIGSDGWLLDDGWWTVDGRR